MFFHGRTKTAKYTHMIWDSGLRFIVRLDVALKNEYCSTAVTALRYLLKIRPSDVVSHTVTIKNLWAWCRHYALANQSRWNLILTEFQNSVSLHNHAHISFLSCQHGILILKSIFSSIIISFCCWIQNIWHSIQNYAG